MHRLNSSKRWMYRSCCASWCWSSALTAIRKCHSILSGPGNVANPIGRAPSVVYAYVVTQPLLLLCRLACNECWAVIPSLEKVFVPLKSLSSDLPTTDDADALVLPCPRISDIDGVPPLFCVFTRGRAARTSYGREVLGLWTFNLDTWPELVELS